MFSQMKHTHDYAPLTRSEHAAHVSATERSIVVDAESMLWSRAAQRDVPRLEWLVHDDFTGVTRQGVQVDHDDLVDAIRAAVPRGERDVTDRDFHDLPWPLVLTTYTLADCTGTSQHMSIWDISTGLARLRFHQGTADTADSDGLDAA